MRITTALQKSSARPCVGVRRCAAEITSWLSWGTAAASLGRFGSLAHVELVKSRLCDAFDSVIRRVDGDFLRHVAHHGPIPSGGTLPLTRGIPAARAVLDRRTIHIADLQAETDEFPEGSNRARRVGFGSLLSVPLIRAGEALGRQWHWGNCSSAPPEA